MGGTKIGGRKSYQTKVQKYGKHWFAEIGAMGGSVRVPKGFALMPREKVSAAGRKGGLRTAKIRWVLKSDTQHS